MSQAWVRLFLKFELTLFTCLGCDASFTTRKWLSAHIASCADNRTLTHTLYEHKQKSARHGSNRQAKSPVTVLGPLSIMIFHLFLSRQWQDQAFLLNLRVILITWTYLMIFTVK
jgi:hypothetical protein